MPPRPGLAAGVGEYSTSRQSVRQLAGRIEIGSAVVSLDGLRLKVVTKSEIQGQPARQFPIVLEESADRMRNFRLARVRRDTGVLHGAQKESRVGRTSAGRRHRVSGQGGVEIIGTRGRRALQVVSL